MTRRSLVLLLVAAASLAACGGGEGGAAGAGGDGGSAGGVEDAVRITPPNREFFNAHVSQDGRIVFPVGTGGEMTVGELMTSDLTGEDVQPFLQQEVQATEPAFLPDGRVAFLFEPEEFSSDRAIAIAEADGSSFTVLETVGSPYDFAVDASGGFIVYATLDFDAPGGPSFIRRIDLDGSGDVEITGTSSDGREPEQLGISSDGSMVAFRRYTLDEEGPHPIVVSGIDGGNEREVARGSRPVWEPDGDRVAFIGPGGTEADGLPLDQIFVVSSEGGEPIPVGAPHDNIIGPLNWLDDGRILWIYAGTTEEHGSLFAVQAPN
jgi:Tol biopolymer transport system component